MKRIFKWLGALLGVALLAVIALAINVIYFKPFSVRIFYEKAFLEFALDSPQTLSSIRLLEQIGMRGHNSKLDDYSPSRVDKLNQQLRDNYETLKSYDRENMEPSNALSYDIMAWFMQNQIDGIPYSWHGYPVNQLFGIQNGLPSFMANTHHIGDQRDAEDYITRLGQFGRVFDQVIEGLDIQTDKGIIPPQFVITKVLEEMREFSGKPAEENILYTSFTERTGKLEEMDDDTRAALAEQTRNTIVETVYPAYQRLIAYFEKLDDKVDDNYGVWKLPDGDAYYDHQLKSNTTLDISADEIHATGVAEVARIETEMDALLVAQGYTEGSVAERMLQIGDEQRFLYPNTDEGREQILAGYQSLIDEIMLAMPEYFGRLPVSDVEVVRVPEFREKTAPGAYYQGPSLDGTRPGRFYVNLRDLKELPKWSMPTLTYHEAVPGHHFQTALQSEMTGVPQFRKLLGFTAYSEGWALYSERLAKEAGFTEDPFADLGRLKDEMMRAVRLVVDTGIHRKRWSREQAIEYMASKTGMQMGDVVTEIERYFVLPGQATSYKTGMLKILELRERARQQLGDKFSIREFHDTVLGEGDVPLPILEQLVEAYIENSN